MRTQSLLLAWLLLGCTERVSLGEHDSRAAPDVVVGSSDDGEGMSSASFTGGSTSAAHKYFGTLASFQKEDIAFIEIDVMARAAPRRIRVDANCRVTDHTGLDAAGDKDRCKELFEASMDARSYGCGSSCLPERCIGSIRMHLNDGRELLRDLADDRCSVTVPSVATNKFIHAAWYSAGGHD